VKMNEIVLIGLEERIHDAYSKEAPTQIVGDLFQQMGDYFKMYKVYCAAQTESLSKLEELQHSNAQFKAFLNECKKDPRCRLLNLYNFLIKPVQRLCKYPLLLRELYKNTPEEHPDSKRLLDAKNKIEEVVQQVNDGRRQFENQQRILALQNEIEDVDALVAPARELLKEGFLLMQGSHSEKPSKHRIILFNDLLLICKRKDFVLLSSKEFVFRIQVPFNQIQTLLWDPWADNATKNAFQVTYNQRQYVILSSAETQDSMKWFEDLKIAVQQFQHKRSLHLDKSINIHEEIDKLKKLQTENV